MRLNFLLPATLRPAARSWPGRFGEDGPDAMVVLDEERGVYAWSLLDERASMRFSTPKPCPIPHAVSKSRQPRSSIARKMRSKWCHHIPDGILLAACHTGVAICHSTDRR